MTIGKCYLKYSSTPSKNRFLRVFMSPQYRKICISITFHHQFLGWVNHYTIALVPLEIPIYSIHICLMLYLGVMCIPVTLVNRKRYIWSCVWCQIQHHPYNRSIWIGPIFLRLRTIRVCYKRCINLGGCWQPITMLHPCDLQYFLDQYSLIKLKSTIIQCIDINYQELRHWLSLWLFPIVTGTILLERLHYIINIIL